jgi:branched-chain amino acid aminotransferase
MHSFLLHNDEILDAGSRVLSPGQVGLLNGWGVFSTLRVYDGVLFAWERHFARMQRDATRLRVPFPAQAEWMEERMLRLVEANQAWNSTLRVVVVRNQGGMWEGPAAAERKFDLIVMTADVADWGEGVRLGVVPHARYAASEFAGVKYLSWSQNLTWLDRAHEQGLDEVVLLNEGGEISECTSANLFIVTMGKVLTPPLASGCLPGVTRAMLLEEVRVPGLTISEKTLLPDDVESADEVFITSTTREILPVTSIDGWKVRQGREASTRLHQAFRNQVESYVAPRRRAVTA